MSRSIAGIVRSVIYFEVNGDILELDPNDDPDSPYIRDSEGNLLKKEHVQLA